MEISRETIYVNIWPSSESFQYDKAQNQIATYSSCKPSALLALLIRGLSEMESFDEVQGIQQGIFCSVHKKKRWLT